jgi:hypothetical protein
VLARLNRVVTTTESGHQHRCVLPYLVRANTAHVPTLFGCGKRVCMCSYTAGDVSLLSARNADHWHQQQASSKGVNTGCT